MKIASADMSVETLVLDKFKLDGGAMFGSVPKPLWSKLSEPDALNRINLVSRALLIRSGNRVALVETGCGRKWSEKERGIFAIENLYSGELASLLPDITDVIVTHLHFDHGGGISFRGLDGTAQLSFPKAAHYVSRDNYETALSPNMREKASYLPDNIAPLTKCNLKHPAVGEEILPGVVATLYHGHTAGLMALRISVGNETILFPADVVPTSAHLQIPYVMGYDICAKTSMLEKQQLLDDAEGENQLIIFGHDPLIAAGRVRKDAKGKYEIFDIITD
jgi:glyoxylase-like metal-dependent hydrolase (beta-lactamase superfamily II)